MKKYAIYACLFLLTGCVARSGKSDKPVITVTIEAQRYFTEGVAGDKFEVECLVPKGTSPETYDLATYQLEKLNKSRAYLRIGFIGVEQTWGKRMVDNAPKLDVFDTSRGINLIFEAGHSHGKNHHVGSADPHVWNSAANAIILTNNTYQALRTLDPENEPYYAARRDSLCERIRQVDTTIRQELALPGSAQSFMIYHPALSYFARDYGLTQIPIEESGKEPSPAYLKELVDQCREEKVRVIFVQPEFDKSNAEIIARETGAKIVAIDPLNPKWEEEMLHITQALINP